MHESWAPGDSPSPTSQLSALVVAAEPGGAALASAMLRLGGYRVATADSAAAACAILQSRAPDLILLDLHLPSQAALSLARQLRSLPAASGLPLLALVAAFEPSDLAAASSTGFDACLAQPFSRVGLLAAAAQARKRRRDLRA